jgi:hypothetical protein
VLRAILDAANECLGHFDDRPAGERWCDTLFHVLDLAAFAAELGWAQASLRPAWRTGTRAVAVIAVTAIPAATVQTHMQSALASRPQSLAIARWSAHGTAIRAL